MRRGGSGPYGSAMPEHPNADLLTRFYDAFDRSDGATMSSVYAPDATFWDPVFLDLSDGEPGAMWRMLTGRSNDLRVELLDHSAGDNQGSASCIARYTFAQTGRPVANRISSTFRFRDGLVVEQRDEFSFPRWARQALGPTGLLLGWTPMVRAKVQGTARGSLEAFRRAEQ